MHYDPLTLAAAFVVGTIAVARAVRLVTSDAYPPMAWLRDRWQVWSAGRWEANGKVYTWSPLLTCPFCFAPYAAAVDLAWILTAGVEPVGFWSQAWWICNLWAAVSYLSAILVVRDEPPEDQ